MGRNADTHIRVTEETWQELNQRKGPGDSFDDIITELLGEDDRDDKGEEVITADDLDTPHEPGMGGQ